MANLTFDQKAALWKFAGDYKVYAAYKAKGDDYYLSTFYKAEERAAFDMAFAHAKADPQFAKFLDQLVHQHDDYYSVARIDSPNPGSSSTPPWQTSMKALGNLESGPLGLLLQKFGEVLHPDNPEKAAALGAIGKALDTVAGKAATMARDKAAAKDFGKKAVPEFSKPSTFERGADQSAKSLGKMDKMLKEIESLSKSSDSIKPEPTQKPEPNKDSGKSGKVDKMLKEIDSMLGANVPNKFDTSKDKFEKFDPGSKVAPDGFDS